MTLKLTVFYTLFIRIYFIPRLRITQKLRLNFGKKLRILNLGLENNHSNEKARICFCIITQQLDCLVLSEPYFGSYLSVPNESLHHGNHFKAVLSRGGWKFYQSNLRNSQVEMKNRVSCKKNPLIWTFYLHW